MAPNGAINTGSCLDEGTSDEFYKKLLLTSRARDSFIIIRLASRAGDLDPQLACRSVFVRPPARHNSSLAILKNVVNFIYVVYITFLNGE